MELTRIVENLRKQNYRVLAVDLGRRFESEMPSESVQAATITEVRAYFRKQKKAPRYVSDSSTWDYVRDSLPAVGLKKGSDEEENDRQLEMLDKDSRLAVLIHGLSAPLLNYDGRRFSRLRTDLLTSGIHSVTMNYNDRIPFDEYSQRIGEQIRKLMKQVPCGDNIACLGQSTGGDVLRFIVAGDNFTGEFRNIKGYVFAAPMTNGKIPDMADSFIFGQKVNYCSPISRRGLETIELLQKGISPRGVTLASVNDAFVPTSASLDYRGKNLIVGGFGHLDQTGTSTKFNRVYLACLNEIFEK